MAIEREEEIKSYVVDFNTLPIECISIVVSFTTPTDACRFATLSTTFNNAANSNLVWDRFLPSDYREIVLRSNGGHFLLNTLSKKELFMYLSDTSLLIDGGLMSFSLEKATGKKCYTIAPRKLAVIWGDTPSYWHWLSSFVPKPRFSEVPRLVFVWWLEIKGEINTSMLSPNTQYAAYLVFQVTSNVWGLNNVPTEVEVETTGGKKVTERAYLDPRRGGIFDKEFERNDYFAEALDNVKVPKMRPDGWVEVEIGQFFTTQDDDEVRLSVMEVKGAITKGGLVVEGIEIRPIN